MKPPVDAPDVQADQARGIDLERVERGGELVAAAADVRLALRDRDGRVAGSSRSPGLQVRARGVALAHPDLAGEDQCLGPRPRLGEAALDEELVQALSGRLAAGVPRRSRAHPRIVAQPASPRITSPGGTPRESTDHAGRSRRS